MAGVSYSGVGVSLGSTGVSLTPNSKGTPMNGLNGHGGGPSWKSMLREPKPIERHSILDWRPHLSFNILKW